MVDFGSSMRNVIIDSGEAYFEVAHDAYTVELIGAEHVGLGLDFVFDQHTGARHLGS